MTTVIPPRPRTTGPTARRTPARRQLTGAAACTALCLAVAALWTCCVLVHPAAPGAAVPRGQLAVLLYALPTAGAGMLLHAHRPGSPLGWVMLVYALTSILPGAAGAPVRAEVSDPGVVGAVAVLRSVCDTVGQTLFHVLPLWLPYGRLTDRRWWLYIGAVALWAIPDGMSFLGRPTAYGRPNPLAGSTPAHLLGSVADRLDGLHDPVDHLLVGVAAAVLLSRLIRPAARPEREPDGAPRPPHPAHRAHVAGMLGAYLLWAGLRDFHARGFGDDSWLGCSLFAAAGAVWAVTVALLVIRDDGRRLDRAARPALTGLLLATGLSAPLVPAAAALSGWLVPGRGAAGLTLLALVFGLGAALPRAARWAAGVVDRLSYGDRARPYQVLRALAERVRLAGDPERLPAVLCGTVAEQLRLPGVALSVSTRAGRRPLAAAGRTDGPGRTFAVVHHGTTVGELTVGLRAGGERRAADDIDLLGSLADQVAPAVASLRRQEDLRASRERIVAAREEERRRLRRDIHDGLGPALAGLRLRVDNAASAAASGAAGGPGPGRCAALPGPGGGGDVAQALTGISTDLALAIKEVRRITDRLGPAPLGEVGLARAIQQLALTFGGAGLAVTATLTPDPLPALPAAVEVAAYRITTEALDNVLRHARAGRADVVVRVDEGTLTLTVQDDGVGHRQAGTGAPAREPAGGEGAGIRTMADRAAEVGGRCTIGPPASEHGTRVTAVLPRFPSGGGPGAV
ncbi:sensor histidine kinase [Kitasatospora sp. NPDC059327]|uniref:sensor histidine kinase n=1 Tax=Kitasatospora sp. NPDC059327 TaxID=3346803 RepID=UPI0036B13140